jgi:AcrR family transcriptional regulator
MSEMGLRERSRIRRHEAIERAAMRLFAERGYEATTVADIAAAVEVAPRTVSFYFPTKIDLAVSYSDACALRLADSVLTRADDETTFAAMFRWLRTEAETDPDVFSLQRTMLQANASLRGHHTAATERAQQVVGDALTDELGRPMDDIGLRLLAGAASGVISVLFELDTDSVDLATAAEAASRMLDAAIAALPEAN